MHPPPNISGSLTIGHCLQLSLEDALVRWHRMRGFNTLFQPGYDHAGISTWAAIGRELAKEGRTQRELGRAGFDEYAQQWQERYGGTIMVQFRRLGASLDYRRTRYTMDPGYYRAVIRWFVHLYERGWIYRANRIVNWCPRDQTALSDLEVEHEETDDTLSYVRYPLADGSGHVTIATVRSRASGRAGPLMSSGSDYALSMPDRAERGQGRPRSCGTRCVCATPRPVPGRAGRRRCRRP